MDGRRIAPVIHDARDASASHKKSDRMRRVPRASPLLLRTAGGDASRRRRNCVMPSRKRNTRDTPTSEAPKVDDAEPRHYEEAAVSHTLANFASFVAAPMALRRRASAFPGAAATIGDYDCQCPVNARDCLPLCLGIRRECRFRHRPAGFSIEEWRGDEAAQLRDERLREGKRAILIAMDALLDRDGPARAEYLARMIAAIRRAKRRRNRRLAGSLTAKGAIEGPPANETPDDR